MFGMLGIQLPGLRRGGRAGDVSYDVADDVSDDVSDEDGLCGDYIVN